MLSHQEVLARALELRAEIEDLRSATYIVEQFTDSQSTALMFIAAFDMDQLQFVYNVTDANFLEIKALSMLQPDAIAAFGAFVTNMLAYVAGGDHPYKGSLAAHNPDMIRPHDNLDQDLPDDRDVSDTEAQLKPKQSG